MTNSNLSVFGTQVPNKYTANDLVSITSSSDFLKRLLITNGMTKQVAAGLIPIGVIALIDGDKVKNLGKEIEIVVLGVRPLALEGLNDKDVTAYYDQTSDGFKSVMATCGEEDSGKCYGPQFLIWIPSENTFAGFLYGSASARRAAPTLIGMMSNDDGTLKPIQAILRPHLVTSKKNNRSWFIPETLPSSAAIANVPTQDQVTTEIEKFNNPVSQEVVPADQTDSGRAR